MKKIHFFSLAIGLCATFLLLSPLLKPSDSNQVVSSGQARLQDKMAPALQFEMRRAYPDMQIDLDAFEQALEEARSQSKKASSSGLTTTPWILEGPTNIGGRINAIAQDPNNPNTILAGTVTGGIFKTTSNGLAWTPIFDNETNLSISEITYEPGNSQVIYVGTGDRNITGFPFSGNGLYKTSDGGQSWTNIGPAGSHITSRIIVDPNDVNRIYVGSMGRPMQRDSLRGLFRSTDGGQTWTQSLFIADQAGIIDLVMDPVNTQTLYATSWDRIRSGTESVVSGPNAGIWKTTNGGDTWNKLSGGLPNQPMSRVSIAIDETNPNRLISAWVDPSNFQVFNIYQSINGGISWMPISIANLSPSALGGFGWYFGNVFINPYAPSEIYLQGVQMHRTTDNGATWNALDPGGFSVHADKHDLMFTGPNSMILATDGGLYKSDNSGGNWQDFEDLPNSQFYRVMPSPHEPGVYFGGMQDNGTARGNNLNVNGWQRVYGADGFQPLFNDDPNFIMAETQNGGLNYSEDLGSSWNSFTNGLDFSDRRNWDQPIIVSHHNKNVFYTGTYRLYRNTAQPANHNWIPISGDLTDGIVIAPRYHNLTTIGESPIDRKILFTGSSDGNVHVSTNAGQSFTNVSAGLPDRYVTSVKGSPFDSTNVLVTLSGYKNNSNTPHVLWSQDLGANWQDVSGDLPGLALNDVLLHPTLDGVWVVASDGGVYATSNYGQHWERVGSNMPLIPVYDMEWDLVNRRLIVGTHARSMQSFPMDSLIAPILLSAQTPEISSFDLYPSPATTQIHLEWPDQIGSWEMFNAEGRKVRGGFLDGQLQRIAIDQLQAGVYFVRAESQGQMLVRRFLKQ